MAFSGTRSFGHLLLAIAFLSGCGLANPPGAPSPRGGSFDWPISTPAAQGLREDLLEQAAYEAATTNFVYSLLVARNGFLVSETYLNGVDADSLASTYSATKSFVSALVGIALQEGHIESLNQRVLDFFPEYDVEDDDRKKAITIEHLLAMQSGFDEESNIGLYANLAANMVAAIIGTELRFDPGTSFLYSTHGSHILSAILSRATGMFTERYAEQKLFRPLGITSFNWRTDQNGIPFGGAGLFLSARDMARFGQLYLQNGVVDQRQIVPAEWVALSTQNHRAYTESWEEMTDVGYGFQWWTGKVKEHPLYFASGYGGQWIVVVPDLEMVVVSMMDADLETEDWLNMEFLIELLDRFILPAVVD